MPVAGRRGRQGIPFIYTMITMMEQKSILLIYPPVALPDAPPAGIARLSGYLRAVGADCRAVDFNLEGMLEAIRRDIPAGDTWTRRAKGKVDKHVAALRSFPLYSHPDRYRRAASDVNRVFQVAGRDKGARMSLSNFVHPFLSPVRSADLAAAARDFRDNPFFPFFSKRIRALFSEKAFDITGISVNFTGQALCAAAIAGFLREYAPETRIVFGGGLITSWMNIPGFSNPLAGIADEMIPGPGERHLSALCGAEKTHPAGRGCTPGFPCDFSDFDARRYLSPVFVMPIAASDGCYWRKCRICPEKAGNTPYRPFPPERVALAAASPDKTPGLLHFTDNALSPKFMKFLAANPPKTPWYGFARITPHLADPDFVAALAGSGCVMLKIGIESASQRVLDAMEKGTTVELISRVLSTLKAASISVYGYLLFGTPAENEDSAFATRDFVLAHADCIDFLNLAIFNLPAYCGEADNLATRPFYEGDLSLYADFVHPEGWHRERVRRFLAKRFAAEKPIRRIIKNDPPFFSSGHAPFFAMAAPPRLPGFGRIRQAGA